MKRRTGHLVLLASTLAACSDPAPVRDAGALADVTPRDDLGADVVSPPDVGFDSTVTDDVRIAPYDAGVAPPCTTAAFTRHVADQRAGAEAVELGGFVLLGDHFLAAVRQGNPRINIPDGAPVRRDTVDIVSITSAGFPEGAPTTVFDSTSAGTDLSTPALVPSGSFAWALFRESLGLQGRSDFTTRIRGVRFTTLGVRQGAEVTLDDRGDPYAAGLPGGAVLSIAPRIVARTDAGFVVATPNSVRIDADGRVPSAMGVDLTNVIPGDADSVMMRPAPDGAVLVFRRVTDVQIVRFDPTGLVDTRAYIARNVDATRLDDAAVLSDAIIVGWAEVLGETRHAIHVAVLDREGHLRANTIIERFDAPGTPVVSITPAHGGAAVSWIRGRGEAAVLRGTVMQPDGTLRAPVRELLPIPGADGRLLAVGEGRSLAILARDGRPSSSGLTFGRLCLPE